MALFPVAGALAPKFDPRKLVACGFAITTFGLFRMTEIDLNVSFGLAVSWRAVIALGLPFLFIPINTLCYAGIPQEKYNEVSGLTALMRNLGGSVGISFVTTLLSRLSQKHLAMLTQHTVLAIRRSTCCATAWRAHGNCAAAPPPTPLTRAGAQIYDMAQFQAPPAGLCGCVVGDGDADRLPDSAALHHAPAEEGWDLRRQRTEDSVTSFRAGADAPVPSATYGFAATFESLGAAPITQKVLTIFLSQSTNKRYLPASLRSAHSYPDDDHLDLYSLSILPSDQDLFANLFVSTRRNQGAASGVVVRAAIRWSIRS